ncbi:MAG: adenylyl cyclase [Acidobacteria bacterium]|nr:MAG: adenylyl cyclase [Acidobacteriota bacterium]PYU44699.1 MAG: adenylyl cyclase [Acidobacteriota bacterium]PYU73151.1 MAG: adenylyl cyclase [Acidobacteriota bacterium]
MQRIFGWWLIAGLSAGLCGAVGAQEITGSVFGSVVDMSGAIVSGATVTVENADKNDAVIRVVMTNENGDFVVQFLPIGHYTFVAETKGFKKAERRGVTLNVNDKLTLNFTLEPGALTETATVLADASPVELQTATASGLITGTEIRELAINTRNYEQLVALTPGVSTGLASDQLYVGVSSPTGLSNQINFSVNGGRPTQNNWSVDGADNVDRGANLTLLSYPSVDSIEEFRVVRGQYDAEYGRSSSGQINVITRSGTGAFHGGVYEFFRNDVLNANSFFNNQNRITRPPLRYNDFGGTFGGPIFIPNVYNSDKKKTFFFFSEEVRRVLTYSTFDPTLPSQANLNGTFRQPVCLNTSCSQTGTQILPGQFNPGAAAYIKDIYSKLKLPAVENADGTGVDSPFVARNTFNLHQEILKIDHIFSAKFALMGRFENDTIPTIEPGGLFTGSALPGVATTSTNSPGRQFTIRATSTFTPSLVNEAGYNYSYGGVTSDPSGLGASKNSPDVITAIKLPFAAQVPRVPNLSFNDSEGLFGFGSYRDFNRNHNMFDNISYSHGKHTFRMGFQFNAYQKSENAGGGNEGTFSFDDTDPSGNATLDQEWANFLLGTATSFAQTNVDFRAEIRQKQWEIFGQDTYRVKPNLTMTLGVRYSRFNQPTDENGHATGFDSSLYDMVKAPQIDSAGLLVPNTGTALNGVIIGGVNSPFGSAAARHDTKDFAPRIGLAWDPFKTGKTSIRAGFGIFYDSPSVGTQENGEFSNPPFAQNITISNTVLNNPGSVVVDVNLSPPALTVQQSDWRQPYVQEWSLDVQREVWHKWFVDAGYFGNEGTHLVGVIDINEPKPLAYVAAGISAPITGGTTQLLNRVRPFLGYDAINVFSSRFDSNYHALQVTMQKHFTGSSLISMNYTYSHGITNAQSDFRTPQNTYDLAAERGESQFDRRQVFNLSYIYEFPFYRSQSGFTGHAFGGWEVSGIVYAYTGLPLTVTGGRAIDPAGLGVLDANSFAGRRPNEISNPNVGALHSFAQWFNTAAFVNPPNAAGPPGNARRGAIRGPGLQRWDISLFKNTKIREHTSLQFRAEAFNIFNHTNFDGIRLTRQSGSFGRVISTRDPRIMQLALKLYF